MARPEIVCSDPDTVLGNAPCAQCYSISELKRVLVIILGYFDYYDMPEDLDELLEDSACWTCTSKKQKLEAMVTVMGQFIFQFEQVEADLKNMLACLRCMTEGQVDAALIYLICEFFDLPA